MKVVTVDEMRRIEVESEARGVSTSQLMENAGLAVAEQARDALGELKSEHVVVLVGPGNNGSDGLVAARHLDDWGARVHVYVCGERPADDPHLETLRDRAADVRDVRVETRPADLRRTLDTAAMVIDAMLGTGRSRPLRGSIAAACAALAEAKTERRSPVRPRPRRTHRARRRYRRHRPRHAGGRRDGRPRLSQGRPLSLPRRRARGASLRGGHRDTGRPRRGRRP